MKTLSDTGGLRIGLEGGEVEKAVAAGAGAGVADNGLVWVER